MSMYMQTRGDTMGTATPKIRLDMPASQMGRIVQLTEQRQRLLNDCDDMDSFNTERRAMLRELSDELESAWEVERRYRAAMRAARN